MSTFLARASTRISSSADYDHLMRELSRHPEMRKLGWSGSNTPQNGCGGHTLGIGNPHSDLAHILDKSVRDDTHSVLTRLGWLRNTSEERRHWSYSHPDHPVSLRLQWRLGNKLSTEHPLGKDQFPIKYLELYVQDEQGGSAITSSNITYQQYIKCWSKDPHSVEAFSFPTAVVRFIADTKQLLLGIKDDLKLSFDDLTKAFKSKEAFSVLKSFGFSLAKMGGALKKFLAVPARVLVALLKELANSEIVKSAAEKVAVIDRFLESHPVLKKLAGPGLAGLLLWMWLNSAFLGDLDMDFNLSNIVAAFQGSFSLKDLFLSEDGLTSLTTLLLGSFTPISVPWVASSISALLIAFLFTSSKNVLDHKLAAKLKTELHLKRLS